LKRQRKAQKFLADTRISNYWATANPTPQHPRSKRKCHFTRQGAATKKNGWKSQSKYKKIPFSAKKLNFVGQGFVSWEKRNTFVVGKDLTKQAN